jgi:hypothetical protein
VLSLARQLEVVDAHGSTSRTSRSSSSTDTR